MMAEFLQFLFSGLTVGAIYGLVALGFSLIYNASHVINFAQGEFVMIGGMATVALAQAGLPLPVAILLAVVIAIAVGLLLEKLAIEPARDATVVTLIIITIGASIFIRGVVQVVLGKNFHALPAFSGNQPLHVGGATILPQSLWILGTLALVSILLFLFFHYTLTGKAMLASAYNRLAAQLVGIRPRSMMLLSFGLAAGLGAVGGILITPIASTSSEAGIMLGLKGFSAAIVGGIGRPAGAIVGGLVVGVAEAIGAGYISSEYKDAIAFIIILLVLFFLPNGLFGTRSSERV